MSLYSEQIDLVIRERLIPKMRGLATDIAAIEPYSFTSAELERYKRELDYYCMIYDFLEEYQTGNEEIEASKLVSITKLVGRPTRERRTNDYLGGELAQPYKPALGYRLFVNNQEITAAQAPYTFLTAGSEISISLVYTPSGHVYGARTMSVTAAGVQQVTGGFTNVLQGLIVPLSSGGGTLVITARAYENGIPLTATETFTLPIASIISNVLYYGSAIAGSTPVQIQGLTTLIEERGPKTLYFSPNNQVLYFAYPAAFGFLTSIIDQNNYNVTADFAIRTENFTLSSPNYGSGIASYYIYEGINSLIVSNFKLTFNF
jgi:hypothetical protein